MTKYAKASYNPILFGGEIVAKTSAEVKNRYANKAYERVTIVVKKGEKEKIKSLARANGQSVSRLIVEALNGCAGEELLTVLDSLKNKV